MWIFLGLVVIAIALYSGLGLVANARYDAAFHATGVAEENAKLRERLGLDDGDSFDDDDDGVIFDDDDTDNS